jgi:parallel beta-helix repeat protein
VLLTVLPVVWYTALMTAWLGAADVRSLPSAIESTARVYYVDATLGDDEFTGVSADCDAASMQGPWRTLARVNSASLNPGDAVLFKRGGTWRGTLTVPSSGTLENPIVFGAYGSGTNPTITGADLVATSWGKHADGLWQIPMHVEPDMVLVNGTIGSKKAVLSSLTVNDDWHWSGGILFLRSTTDPSGQAVEYSVRQYGVYTNRQDHLVFHNLTVEGTTEWGAGIAIERSQFVTVDDCDASKNYWAGIKASGEYGRITVSHNVVSRNGSHGIVFLDGWGGHNDIGYNSTTFNTVCNNGWRDVEAYGISGRYSYSTLAFNVVYGNGAGGVSHPIFNHGIYVINGTGINTVIESNIAFGHKHGSGIKVTGSGTVSRNRSYDNTSAGIQVGTNGDTDVWVGVYYNLCYRNGYGIAELDQGGGWIDLKIFNNTLYNNSDDSVVGASRQLLIGDSLRSLIVENNILGGEGEREFAGEVQSNLTWDYNLVEHSSLYYGSRLYTWAQWQAEGFDAHGLTANPVFSSAPTLDFTLQAGSPCVDAGADVGLRADHAGNAVPAGGHVDIGAYERPSGDRVAPNAPSGLIIYR